MTSSIGSILLWPSSSIRVAAPLPVEEPLDDDSKEVPKEWANCIDMLIRDVKTYVEDSAVERLVSFGVRMCPAFSCKLSMTRDIIVTEMLLAKVDRAPRSAGYSAPM